MLSFNRCDVVRCLEVIGVVVHAPNLSGMFQGSDDVPKSCEQRFPDIRNVMFLTQTLTQRSYLVEVVPRHGWEQAETQQINN